jgi:hypothetical protein
MTPGTEKRSSGGIVCLKAPEKTLRRQMAGFLRQLGYRLGSSAHEEVDLVIVVVAEGQSPATGLDGVDSSEFPVPVLVFGPAENRWWRKAALEAGAFACLSLEAPVEEKASLIFAASRYRAAQIEIQVLRRESDVLFTNLLRSYGEEAEKLKSALQERKQYQEELELIKNRILQFIL